MILKTVETRYQCLLSACGTLAGVMIAAIALLVTVDVIIRNLEIGNLPWLVEVAEYVLFGSTFLAAPWVLSLRSHVKVDLFSASLSGRSAQLVEIVACGLGLVICIIIMRYGFLVTVEAWSIQSVIAKELRIPEWSLLWIVPFSSALLSIELLKQLFCAIRSEPKVVETSMKGGV